MRVQMFLLIKYADRDEKHEKRQPRPSIRSYEKRQITLQLIMQVKNNCECRKLMLFIQGMLEKVSHLIGEMTKVLIKQNYV